MISRRDALKLAADKAAATPLAPFAVSPQEAAALLNEPAEFGAGSGRGPTWAADELDPVSFAETVDGLDWMDHFESGAAPEMAAYTKALRVTFAVLGVLPKDLPREHPLWDLDDAARAMWVTAHMAGVRQGALSEHLRLSMITPARPAPRVTVAA